LIIVAFLIADFEYAPSVSLLLTLLISVVICAAILIFCKYSRLLGMLLGKRPAKDSSANSKAVQRIITLITLPLAMRLLGLI